MIPELVIYSRLNPAEAASLVDMQVGPGCARPRVSAVGTDVKAGPADGSRRKQASHDAPRNSAGARRRGETVAFGLRSSCTNCATPGRNFFPVDNALSRVLR